MSADCLEYTPRGLRELKAVPKPDRDRIREDLEHLRIGAMNLDVKPLTGRRGYYRLRRGDWRVVYKLDQNREAQKQTISVVHVVNRKDFLRAVKNLAAA